MLLAWIRLKQQHLAILPFLVYLLRPEIIELLYARFDFLRSMIYFTRFRVTMDKNVRRDLYIFPKCVYKGWVCFFQLIDCVNIFQIISVYCQLENFQRITHMLFSQKIKLTSICKYSYNFGGELCVDQLLREYLVTLISNVNQPKFFFIHASCDECIL